MEIEKIFKDLESYQVQESDEAKTKIAEWFKQNNKEQWLVHCVMDYFFKTDSLRVAEVLVKVQAPHDGYIFDRLVEWLKTTTHRMSALKLFSFIVREHPTWLVKVEKHRLIKEILKLMTTEKEIVPLMTALLSIIILLPIIPNFVPNFLNELFEVFGYLASCNEHNANCLPEDKLVYLQLGLQMLFHRLYGMYPCNFLTYLKEYTRKERNFSIFHHTIKPLLNTVRVHPLLITASTETETNQSRWKQMEPHDVVVECANVSLPIMDQDIYNEQISSLQLNHQQQLQHSDTRAHSILASGAITDASECLSNFEYSASGSGFTRYPSKHFQHQQRLDQNQFSILSPRELEKWRCRNPYQRPYNNCNMFKNGKVNVKVSDGQQEPTSPSIAIWSPHDELAANATASIPLTPTPYMLTMSATSAVSNAVTSIMSIASGSSPPEAAVEATPETTPMKDVHDEPRHVSAFNQLHMNNPHAVRAIFAGSQPSSPMRKEQNHFNFPTAVIAIDNTVLNTLSPTTVSSNASTTTTSTTTTTTTFVEQEHRTRVMTTTTTFDRRVQQIIRDRTQHLQSPFQTIESQQLKMNFAPTPTPPPATQPTTLKQQPTTQCGYLTPIDTNSKSQTPDIDAKTTTNDTDEHITKTCLECTESEGKPCKYGGLHVPTSRSMQLLVKAFRKRNRMASYCHNDTRTNAYNNDNVNSENLNGVNCSALKMRRTKSCSSISTPTHKLSSSPSDDDNSTDNIVKDLKFSHQQSENRLQKSQKIIAIPKMAYATATSSQVHAECQTVETFQKYYENLLYSLLCENNNLHLQNKCTTKNPNKILESYIRSSIDKNRSGTSALEQNQEEHQLLGLLLEYERYRREIHAERNRRLLGRSRDKRSLEMECDRLKEQVKSFVMENKKLMQQIDETTKNVNKKESDYLTEIDSLKIKYQTEVDKSRKLQEENVELQKSLNDELAKRKDINYELEALRGQIFNLTTELQQAKEQAEVGLHAKQELARLEAEFIVMGELQAKYRDRLIEMDSMRARDEELQMLQESYNLEIKDLKHSLDERTAHLDCAKQKVQDMQAQLTNMESVITEQKRLLKVVKDESEERFVALQKKYETQKTIIVQMEGQIINLYRPSTKAQNSISPDVDKTDVASSIERNSPLSTSLASSESLSASLRSTELRNLQPLAECGSNSVIDLGTSANSVNTTIVSAATTSTASAIDISNAATRNVDMRKTKGSTTSTPSTPAAAAAATLAKTSINRTHLHLQNQHR